MIISQPSHVEVGKVWRNDMGVGRLFMINPYCSEAIVVLHLSVLIYRLGLSLRITELPVAVVNNVEGLGIILVSYQEK